MPYDLTKLPEHIKEMRERLGQTAVAEQVLVKELADSLNALDQQLLQYVREAANDHQTRRGEILNELQALADNIGMFRPPHDTVQRVVAPEQATARGQIGFTHQRITAGWRQATENLGIEDDLAELELYMTGRDPRH